MLYIILVNTVKLYMQVYYCRYFPRTTLSAREVRSLNAGVHVILNEIRPCTGKVREKLAFHTHAYWIFLTSINETKSCFTASFFLKIAILHKARTQ